MPLAGQQARAAAELDEQLPLAELVGLHHLTEGLVSWTRPGRRKGARQALGPV